MELYNAHCKDCKLTMHENKYPPLKRLVRVWKGRRWVGWNYQIVDHDSALIALSRSLQLSYILYFSDIAMCISLIMMRGFLWFQHVFLCLCNTYISYTKTGWNYQIVAHDWGSDSILTQLAHFLGLTFNASPAPHPAQYLSFFIRSPYYGLGAIAIKKGSRKRNTNQRNTKGKQTKRKREIYASPQRPINISHSSSEESDYVPGYRTYVLGGDFGREVLKESSLQRVQNSGFKSKGRGEIDSIYGTPKPSGTFGPLESRVWTPFCRMFMPLVVD